MPIVITILVKDLFEQHLWEEYCKLTGTDVWCVNEGKMDMDDAVILPESMHSKVKLCIKE